MEQEYINLGELKDFIFYHKLRDMNSIILFRATVSITTIKNQINKKEMDVMISFNDSVSLGKVSLLVNDLDPLLYPTVFDVSWQKMTHVGHVYLNIIGFHTKNQLIGEYNVTIVPVSQ